MLELYHWEPNAFSLKALIALNEKGLEFTSHYVDWSDFEQFRPGGLKLNLEAEHNPESEGPILVHDGAMISESFFMMEYLEDAFPDRFPLKLRTPHGDWQVQVWGRFVGERAAPAVSTLGCHKYLAPALKAKRINSADQVLERMPTQERRVAWGEAIDDSYTDDVLEDSRRKAALLIERIEKALESSDWLVENTYTVADIDAFSLANALPKLLPDACNDKASPRTMAWLKRMRDRPAVKKALATSKTGRPEEAFAPGPEHARWG